MCSDYFKALAREVENQAREMAGQHKVGEGWVSETEVYLLLNEAVGELTKVIQHGIPEGFGQQHLDVWLPVWRAGIEYQGLQHDQPVEFFGGEEAFQRNQARDAAKRAKCERLGIRLIEVRSGYDKDALIANVLSANP
jgi:hypothetical protein